MMSEFEQRSGSVSSVAAALPSLVKQVKDNSFAILSNNFSHFFTSCDDLFFDLASKAGSNKEQNLYFDSMREVRMKKPQVWSLFKEGYEENFRNLTKSRFTTTTKKPLSENVSLESIQLVDKDDMEQDVAIVGIVNKARIDNQELLYQLNCRFDYLMPDVKVNETNNPLDPAQICNAVAKALRVLDLDIRCKVILLKHLDRTVIVELKNIYSLANELLVSAGILPQIRFGVKKQTSAVPPVGAPEMADAEGAAAMPGADATAPLQRTPGQAGIQSAAATTFTLGQVLDMFQQLRQSGVSIPNAVSRPVSAHSVAIAPEQLIEQLTTLQLSADYLEQPHRYNIRTVVEKVLEENKAKGKPDALNQSDEDIINLVAMFFDFVLDDRNLPVPFQALISRLQIPVLKVALKDRNFFSHTDHPARKFINEIAASAVGWDQVEKEAQDLLYKEVNRVVHHVIEHFTGDVSTFEQALLQLQTALKSETTKANVLEKRTQEAAQGKAKAEHAREQANQALLKRLRDVQIPENILSFLVRDWQKVLMYVHLKHGADSTEWLEANQVIDDIAWALRPHSDERSLSRVERLRDEVVRKVAHGLEGSSISREQALNTLSIIEQTFELVIQRRLDPSQLIGLQPEHLATLGQAPTAPGKSWEEMTALERQQLKMQAAAQEYITKASSLRPGVWVEYAPPNTSRAFRCKLAMITEPGDSYVFVNRFGLRVFEKKLNEVAYDMQKGYVKLLESGMLFDRAMDNISNRLKKLAS